MKIVRDCEVVVEYDVETTVSAFVAAPRRADNQQKGQL
jgi:hypothetical protein